MEQESAILYVDSNSRINTDLNQALYESDMLIQEVEMIAVNKVNLVYDIPTITPHNNELIFQQQSDGVIFTVTLTPGHYTITSLMSELTTQLNNASAGVEATPTIISFSSTLKPGTYNDYTLTGSSPFRFLNCSHIKYGASTTGLGRLSKVLEAEITLDYFTSIDLKVYALNTRYIDITAVDFTNGALSNTFSRVKSFGERTSLHRVHIDFVTLNETRISAQDYTVQNLHWKKIIQKRFRNLQINLYDEYGELIYSPNVLVGTRLLPFDTVKYELEIAFKTS